MKMSLIKVFKMCGLKEGLLGEPKGTLYFELVYFVTAFVPSLTACFASSPGSRSRTEVWISRDDIVLFLTSLDASDAICSNRSLTKEFITLIAFVEMPTSG